METDNQFADGEVPEGWDAIEVVGADEFNGEDGDETVLLDENGERVEDESEGEEAAPRKRQSAEDNPADADRFRRERDEARAEAERLRQEVNKVQNKDAWVARKAEIKQKYTAAKANIFNLSNNAEDPNNFINEQIEILNDWRDAELEKEFRVREETYMGEIVRLKLPEYAQKLAGDYGLKAADAKRIQQAGSPAKMEAMAEALYELRRDDSRVAQNNKKAARFAQNSVSTSSGARGSARKVKAGSDEHLALLLAGAVER